MSSRESTASRIAPGLRERWRGVPVEIARFARRQPVGFASALVLVFLLVVAALAPAFAPADPLTQSIPDRLKAPSQEHLLGTDALGRDLFSRIIFGSRVSLYVGFLSIAIGGVIGTSIGIFTGFRGGLVDIVIQRFVDVLMGFPSLVLTMVLVATLGASLNNVVLAIAIIFAPRVQRIARAAALAVRENDYITAATALGSSQLRILMRHMLPNCMAPIIVLCTGYLGTAIITEAALSFLGLGVPPPHPSWGGMLQGAARLYTEAAPWLVIFPGLAITVVVYAFNLTGDAIRDTVDPRLQSRRTD